MLQVHVPKQTYDRLFVENKNGMIAVAHVEAADIHLATENGIVAMYRISANKINALTVNGKVKGENVETETFEATTENGSVEGKRIHANTLDLTTENGEIRLFEVTGDIFGKTKNGSIFIEVTDLDRSLDLSTTNGRIDIKSAEKPTNASIHAFVKNGSIDIFGDKKPHTVIGDGKHQIHLETENGSIKLGGR